MHVFSMAMIVATLGISGCFGPRLSAAAAPAEPQPIPIPCATNMSFQVLGGAAPKDAEGLSLVLVRIIFGVDSSLGAHTHPGTLIVSLETGSVGLSMVEHGEMTVMRS